MAFGKKIKRFFLWTTGSLLLIAIAAFLILRYNLKRLVEETVWLESGKTYTLSISKFKYSLGKKQIKLGGVRLNCMEKDSSKTSYTANIPELFLSIDSWRLLLIDKKLDIDSLYLSSPEFHIRRKSITSERIISDRPVYDVLEILNDVRQKLGIRSLHFRNSSLHIYDQQASNSFFSANGLHFRVVNFSDKADQTHDFLSAEDVDLKIDRQHWKFPGGSSLAFRSMHFSGRAQYFEIDSCYYSTAETEAKAKLSFSADKARWNSHRLADIYVNEELLLDTIYLSSPSVYLAVPEKKKKDSSEFGSNMSKLFGDININYIKVDKGELMLETNTAGRNVYKSSSTDLVLEDLDINRDSLPHISIGKIGLQLNYVEFSTADSQYLLRIREFGMMDNDLICREATFEPTGQNFVNSGFRVNIPSFILKQVSIPDLLEKKFKAVSGIFQSPDVSYSPKSKKARQAGSTEEKLSNLYHSLNGLAQLINVEDLSITGAEAVIVPLSKTGETAIRLNDINALIQLNRFLKSEGLVNMNEAIPLLTAERVTMETPGIRSVASKLRVEGKLQKNQIGSLTLNTPSGARMVAEQIYWPQFDLDKAIRDQDLELDSVFVGSLLAEINPFHKRTAAKDPAKDYLPATFIRKLNIGEIFLFMQLRDSGLIRSKVESMEFDSLQILDDQFSWALLKAGFRNFNFRRNEMNVMVPALDIKTNEQFTMSDAEYVNQNHKIFLRSAQIKTSVRSIIKNENIRLEDVLIEGPVLDLSFVKNASEGRAGFLSANERSFQIDRMRVTEGKINLRDSAKGMVFQSDMSGDFSNLNLEPGSNPKFLQAVFTLTNGNFLAGKRKMDFSRLGLQFENGMLDKDGAFSAAASASWTGLNYAQQQTPNGFLQLNGARGKWSDEAFSLIRGEAPDIKKIPRQLELSQSDIRYQNEKFFLKADAVGWSGEKKTLATDSLQYRPLISRDSFFAASAWQQDYITFSAAGASISGLDIESFFNDSSLMAEKLILNAPDILASRNKKIPFQHGIEKLMPTALLKSLKRKIEMGKIELQQAAVIVNEISSLTGKEGNVHFTGIDATVGPVKTHPAPGDSLRIRASGRLMDHYIRSMKYHESYDDSLSGFIMRLNMSGAQLSPVGSITVPLAAVNIERGVADTLFADFNGNKYSSFGRMNFHYRDLRIRLLNANDSLKRSFVLGFENLLANSLVLRSKNKKSSVIFFERDREKFIFNFWAKSVMSGLLTSAGVKSSKKLEKAYRALNKPDAGQVKKKKRKK